MAAAPEKAGEHRTDLAVRHTVSVTLQGRVADIDEAVVEAFRGRVRSVVERSENDDGLVELTFTQDSDDLWLTLLTTMSASWATGYEPVEIAARMSGGGSGPEGSRVA